MYLVVDKFKVKVANDYYNYSNSSIEPKEIECTQEAVRLLNSREELATFLSHKIMVTDLVERRVFEADEIFPVLKQVTTLTY